MAIPFDVLASAGIGILRGVRGYLRHGKKANVKFDGKRFLGSVALAGLIGLVLELALPSADLILQLLAVWVGTDVVEDIVRKIGK